MIAIDIALLVVLAMSTLISLFRGFFKEAISVCTWVLALWAAWKFGPQAALQMSEWGTSVMRLWAGRGLIFITVLFIGGVLNWLLGMLLARTGLSGTDRVIGMVFGLARGVILVGIIVVILEQFGFDETPWWYESKLIPYAAPVVDTIRHLVEDGQGFLDSLEASDLPEIPEDIYLSL